MANLVIEIALGRIKDFCEEVFQNRLGHLFGGDPVADLLAKSVLFPR